MRGLPWPEVGEAEWKEPGPHEMEERLKKMEKDQKEAESLLEEIKKMEEKLKDQLGKETSLCSSVQGARRDGIEEAPPLEPD